jgi:ligand-binding sensor domain-containing protein
MIRDRWPRTFRGFFFVLLVTQFILGFANLGFPENSSQSHVNPFENRGLVAPSIQALASTDAGTIYAGSFGQGVFVSHDQGNSWTAMNTGLSDRFILCLTIDQQGVVYAGTVRGGVFRTKKDGVSWELINQGLKRVEVKSLLVHQRSVYAGTGRGVYQWHESDQTWVVIAQGLDQTLVSSLIMMKNQRLYAGTAGKGVLWLDTTKPGTATWQQVDDQFVDAKERLRNTHIRILTKNDDETLFVGTQDGGIFHSVDHGESWQAFGRSLPNDSIRGIVSLRSGVFVATGLGVFTTDLPKSKWVAVNTGLTERAIQAMIVTPKGALFAGTSAGAFRSQDRGGHWVNVSEGLGAQFSMPRPYF